MIRRNSLKAWVLAARPKTLSGASVPVMIGTSIAYRTMEGTTTFQASQFVIAALLCFIFAFIMQIDANFINDYYDCLKGRDNEERIGPLRACQQGWITMKAMRIGIALTTILAALCGLAMFYVVSPAIMLHLIMIGAACILFCFLYTTCLASWGLGDLLVLVFFGIVPVCGTYYVEVSEAYRGLTQIPWLMGIACGLVVDTLLIVNNYRDYHNDKAANKRTLVVFIGKKYSEYLYLTLPTLALVAVLFQYGWTNLNLILSFAVYFLFTQTWNQMRIIGEGKALNKVLGKTARNIFAYGILISLLVNLQ